MARPPAACSQATRRGEARLDVRSVSGIEMLRPVLSIVEGVSRLQKHVVGLHMHALHEQAEVNTCIYMNG